MKFESVCIAVSDVKRSQKFYEDLFGLEVFQDYGINVSFKEGIALQQEFDWLLDIPKEKVMRSSHNMELYFEEDDFDNFVEKLKNYPNIKYVKNGVKEAVWGQRSIHFYDLDGHIIEVGENLKDVVKRFLNSGLTMEETSQRMEVSVSDLEKVLSN